MSKSEIEKTTFTTDELSIYIGVDKRTIESWRQLGEHGPAYHKLGGLIRYKITTVDAWLAATERQHS